MTARFGPILLSLPFLLMLLYLEPASSRTELSNNRSLNDSPRTKPISVKKKQQHHPVTGKGKKSQLYTDDLPSYPTTVISEIKENAKRKKSKKKKRINDKKASKIIPVYPPIHPLKASMLLMSLLKLSNYLSDVNSVNKNTVESLANLSNVIAPTPPPTVSNIVTKSPSTDKKSDDLSAIPGDGFLISDLIADLLLAMFGY